MGILTALLVGSLISAGVSAAASLGTSAIQKSAQESANQTNLKQVEETNQTNLELAREDREFQTEMANTAIQRQVADYKASGLNPVLAAGGNGAPVVSVNSANQQAGHVLPAGFDLSGISSATQSITNLLLVSKLLGTTGFQRYYLGMNSAGKISGLLGRVVR